MTSVISSYKKVFKEASLLIEILVTAALSVLTAEVSLLGHSENVRFFILLAAVQDVTGEQDRQHGKTLRIAGGEYGVQISVFETLAEVLQPLGIVEAAVFGCWIIFLKFLEKHVDWLFLIVQESALGAVEAIALYVEVRAFLGFVLALVDGFGGRILFLGLFCRLLFGGDLILVMLVLAAVRV